jgi:xanthine/uracil/vitamin C permease (AzgA family)
MLTFTRPRVPLLTAITRSLKSSNSETIGCFIGIPFCQTFRGVKATNLAGYGLQVNQGQLSNSHLVGLLIYGSLSTRPAGRDWFLGRHIS